MDWTVIDHNDRAYIVEAEHYRFHYDANLIEFLDEDRVIFAIPLSNVNVMHLRPENPSGD